MFLQELEEALAADRPLDQQLTYTEVDFRVRDSQGQLATVEMQVAKQRFYIERSLFYTAQTYIRNYGIEKWMTTQNKYSALNKSYGINIHNFDPLDTGRAFHQLELYDRYLHQPLSDLKDVKDMKWSYLNLKSNDFSLIEEEERIERLKAWQAFFKADPLEDASPYYIEQAYEALDHMYSTGKEQDIMETIDRHYMTVREYGQLMWEEGYKKGREEQRKIDRQRMIDKLTALHEEGAIKAQVLDDYLKRLDHDSFDNKGSEV